MAFGADDIKPASRKCLFFQRRHLGGDGIVFGCRQLTAIGLYLETHVEIAAKLDVSAAPGHVGGDGDRAGNAGLGDDLCLLGMEARIQHLMFDLAAFQNRRKRLGFLDADRTDKHRLAALAAIGDQIDDGVIALFAGPVDLVIMVDPLHLDIGRDGGNLEPVDFREFASLGHRRAGHAGQLFIKPEIILEGDRGDRLVLGLDLDSLTRLDGLMKPLREAPAFHCPAGELIDDHDLAVLDHVMAVALEQLVRPQRLVHMMQQPDILDVIERALAHRPGRAEQILGMFDAGLGQRDRAPLLVEIVILGNKVRDDLVGSAIMFRGGLGRTGDDQRRPRLVDQDRVNFVDDGEMVIALHHILDPEFQIVAKIIKPEFIVRAIGDIASIGGAAILIRQIAGDAAHRHAKPLIDASHPGGIARGQIVIHRDNMHALVRQRVQEHRQCRDKGLALTGFHFRNLALMERNAAHQLDIIMALAKGAFRRLADPCERFGKKVIKTAASLETGPQRAHRSGKVIIAQRGDLVFKGVDCRHLRGEFLGRAITARPKEIFRQRPKHTLPRITWTVGRAAPEPSRPASRPV